MKIAIVSPDKAGRIDPPIMNFLRMIPNLVDSVEEADVVIIPITKLDNFEFVKELLDLKKPWVLVDFCEYGWDWDRNSTHLFGSSGYANWITTTHFNWFNENNSDEWALFDAFIQYNPPATYFKRELLSKDMSDKIHPIEYPCYVAKIEPETKEQFDARPLEVFFNWGLSHPIRQKLHGEIFTQASNYGYNVISSFTNINRAIIEEKGRTWASIHTPSYNRIPIEEVMFVNGLAKISVSMPGSGVRCFRHAESPANSIMFMQEDNLAWSFPWIAGLNCFKYTDNADSDKIYRTLQGQTQRTDLHEVYLKGIENCDNYRVENYINNYILPVIQNSL